MKHKATFFYLGAILTFFLPIIPYIKTFASGLALVIGIILTSTHCITVPSDISKWRKLMLNGAVILFGFGLNISQVISVGSQGLLQSILSLAIVFIFGFLLLKLFKIDKKLSQLIIFGTAICGGSAIAATAPVIEADDDQIAISTGVIFVLNTIALFLFIGLSRIIPLTDYQFGVWSALSIHDTSSVIGATAAFSDASLQIATILKLTRTLWIIPIVLVLSFLNKGSKKVALPLFILFFILASIFASIINLPTIYSFLTLIGKMMLSVALYFVGVTLHPQTIKKIGLKSLSFGISLWIISIISGFLIAIFLT